MSFSATPETPTPHREAYTLDLRWSYIDKHLKQATLSGIPPRCGHLANSYGGGIISKADILERLRNMSELGGAGK